MVLFHVPVYITKISFYFVLISCLIEFQKRIEKNEKASVISAHSHMQKLKAFDRVRIRSVSDNFIVYTCVGVLVCLCLILYQTNLENGKKKLLPILLPHVYKHKISMYETNKYTLSAPHKNPKPQRYKEAIITKIKTKISN